MARKDDGIVWDFDTISSVFFLLLFLVIVGQSPTSHLVLSEQFHEDKSLMKCVHGHARSGHLPPDPKGSRSG
jgi:hypothetical protein